MNSTRPIYFLFCLFWSCSSSDDTQPSPVQGPEEAPVLSEISINSANGDRLDVVVPETTQLSLTGRDQFGDFIGVDGMVTWSADNENVSVDSEGLVTAQTVGSSIISASAEGLSADITINTWDSSAPRTEIYVSEVGNDRNGPHRILRYDVSGNYREVYISSGLSRPQDIVFLEDQGIVLVSNLQSNNILSFDIETGRAVGTFATGLAGPTRIDIGPDDLLYVLPWNGGLVRRYELDGTFVDNFTDQGVNNAIGMAWDRQGNYYVSSFNNGSNGFVRKFNANGENQGLFVNSNLTGPTDIWFDNSGNLLVNDWSGNGVKKFDRNGNFVEVFIVGVTQPEGVAILDNGNILIGASGTSSIKMFDSKGNFLEDIVLSNSGGLITPNAVVVRKVNQ